LAGWTAEILIDDMASTDDSVGIARRYSAQVRSIARQPIVELVRDAALSRAAGDWILVLDPDERVTSELAIELRRIAAANLIDVVEIPRVTRRFGKDFPFSASDDGMHARFFKAGTVHWPATVHSRPSLGHLRRLALPATDLSSTGLALVHDSWRSPSQVIEKVARYAPDQARSWREDGRVFSSALMMRDCLNAFAERFLEQRMYRQGVAGFLTASYLAVDALERHAELWEVDGRPAASDQAVRRVGRTLRVGYTTLLWVRACRRAARRLLDGVRRPAD
jgi:glycosyltransferase involved in cell wall biosynthesis